MKKEKGFTLIELLAVIIILGVLMTVAVVGVTRYINDSRRSTYATSAGTYVNDVMNAVNGQRIYASQVGTLYLVPVGTESAKTCVALEKGGVSPFSKTWSYAYVGVKYDGHSNKYFYVSLDGANHAINFTTNEILLDQGGKLIATGADVTTVDELQPNYGLTSSRSFFVGTGTPPTGMTNGSANLRALAGVAGTDVTIVTFVGTDACN